MNLYSNTETTFLSSVIPERKNTKGVLGYGLAPAYGKPDLDHHCKKQRDTTAILYGERKSGSSYRKDQNIDRNGAELEIGNMVEIADPPEIVRVATASEAWDAATISYDR